MSRRREAILNLDKHTNKKVRVKFQGGREVLGVLKGYDPLVNLVLDDTIEFLRDPEDAYRTTGATRRLGLVVARGTTVSMICPEDGHEEIANPFVQEG